MNELFKPCSTLRFFLPEILEKEEAVIYLDTDLIFLDSPEKLWREFQNFNSSQIIGMAPNLAHYNDKNANKVREY